MKVAPGLFVALALAASVLAVALPAKRAAQAMAELDLAAVSLERVRSQAHRVLELRTARQRAAQQKRPEQDLIARVNASLAAAGIDQSHFAGVRPRSDVALTGHESGPIEYRRQSVQLSLRRLRMASLGAFLTEWASSQPLWTPTQIDLTHARGEDARYDARILVSATYIADR